MKRGIYSNTKWPLQRLFVARQFRAQINKDTIILRITT